ncbi:MAG: Crp/Fnr family transcriptional regulator [Nitrospiraceae bacterium]|nr:Crp/Fnr family transcriptional regulator [Nitrospiraceae bacterium]
MHKGGDDASVNGLLAALPEASREGLLAKTKLVSLSVKDVLYHPGDPITTVYFPLTCVISMLTEMKNGATIEIATVGKEGMYGIATYLGIDEAVALGVTQVPGEARQMSVRDFKEATKSDELFDTILRRYAHALLMQIARSGGCNSLHSVEERYTRWLLMMHDRTNVNVFAFTQEFLARMLGVSRARVNIVTRALEKAGRIKNSRNQITVLDWKGLEATSCDCFRFIKQEFARVLV